MAGSPCALQILLSGADRVTPPCTWPPAAEAGGVFALILTKTKAPIPMQQQSASKPPTVSGARDARRKMNR